MLDHRLEREWPFEPSSRICVSPGGRTHKWQGALPAFFLLRRSVHPRSMRRTTPDISRANPFVTTPLGSQPLAGCTCVMANSDRSHPHTFEVSPNHGSSDGEY